MKGHCFILITLLNCCSSEWILLPSVRTNQKEVQQTTPSPRNTSQINMEELKNISKEGSCPDFHNLTMMSFSTGQEKRSEPSNEWEIEIEDVNELLKRNLEIPKTSDGKADLVKKTGEKLMTEAEKQIRNLFSSGSREARAKYFQFPSMEGTLMTISMLLFGVFLTKLILKLLQSHYAKYNTNIGMMAGGIRQPVVIAQTRRTRSLNSELKQIHVMHLIDKYSSQFN